MVVRAPFLAALLVIAASIPWSQAKAQTALTPSTTEVLSLVPQDAIALLTIKPREALGQESFRMMPLEVLTAAGMQYLGIDPLKIERIDAMMGLPLGGMDNLPLAVMVTHGEDIPKPLLQRFAPGGATNDKGLEFWPIPDSPDMVVHLRSPRQAFVGSRSYITRLMKLKQPEGELRTLATGLGEPGHIRLVVVLEQMRDLLVGLSQSQQMQAYPQVAREVTVLVEKIKLIAMDVKLGEAAETTYVIQGASDSDARQIGQSLHSLVSVGGSFFITNLERETRNQGGRVPAATIKYANRMLEFVKEKVPLQPTGNQLTLKLDGQEAVVGQVGILTGLLLPAVQSARNSARMMQSSNNLKQMLLAIHNFADTYKRLANDAALDSGNKPASKLSWRVRILPFMEAVPLYNQFKLDEDWDSPHNIKLLEQMPDFYKHPNLLTKPGHTVYQMPSGPGMLNESRKQQRFRDITDGTSNTIAIVSTVPAAAVPWTKPDEFDPVAQRALLHVDGGMYIVGMLDGSVRRLVATLPPMDWKAMFTTNAGDVAQIPEAP